MSRISRVWHIRWTMVLRTHRPEVVFYLAGADPYEGDRLGRLKLTIDGLRRRDELVLGRCRAAGLPVVVTMSGGYAPKSTTSSRSTPTRSASQQSITTEPVAAPEAPKAP